MENVEGALRVQTASTYLLQPAQEALGLFMVALLFDPFKRLALSTERVTLAPALNWVIVKDSKKKVIATMHARSLMQFENLHYKFN
jgi:hypothetical protein